MSDVCINKISPLVLDKLLELMGEDEWYADESEWEIDQLRNCQGLRDYTGLRFTVPEGDADDVSNILQQLIDLDPKGVYSIEEEGWDDNPGAVALYNPRDGKFFSYTDGKHDWTVPIHHVLAWMDEGQNVRKILEGSIPDRWYAYVKDLQENGAEEDKVAEAEALESIKELFAARA